MRILLANDDGYDAYGICSIARELSKEHEIVVVAPHLNKSCASHSASFFKPILCKQIFDFDWQCYSFHGTPVDCVILGLAEIGKDKPFDLVITGINDVPNLANDIVFSGTVQQAIEADRWGVPSIAISGHLKETEEIDRASKWFVDNLPYLYNMAKISAISINIPHHVREDYACKICPLGLQIYNNHYLSNKIDDITTQYTLVGEVQKDIPQPYLSDVTYYTQGYLTISPIKLWLNDDNLIEKLEEVSK